MHARRRDRVCAAWLTKWHYHAHLSTALATGLRSYFMRSTFSIFQAWAEYTAEAVDDRACDAALDDALRTCGYEHADAVALLDVCARRWRHREAAAAFDALHAHSHFALTSRVFLELAVKHSVGALLKWAFGEYALAVRLEVEERAAGLFWAKGRLQFAFTGWAQLRQRSVIAQSKAASAVFHFVGRLQHLIFIRWREMSREWRARRLGTLAAQLHYEGTLAHKVYHAWAHHAKYIGWRYRQTQAGLLRHWLSLERNIFSSWAQYVANVRGLHGIAEGKFLDARRRELTLAIYLWRHRAEDDAILESKVLGGRWAVLRSALARWHVYSSLLGMLGEQFELSDGHTRTARRRGALHAWREWAVFCMAVEAVAGDIFEHRVTGLLKRSLSIWSYNARLYRVTHGNLEFALEAFGDSMQKRYLDRWRLRCKMTAGFLSNLKFAVSSHSLKMNEYAWAKWRDDARRRRDNLRKLRRSFAYYTNGLAMRCYKSWAKVVGKRARRDEIAQRFLRNVLHRAVGLAWRAWYAFLEQRREIRASLVALAFRTAQGTCATPSPTGWACGARSAASRSCATRRSRTGSRG